MLKVDLALTLLVTHTDETQPVVNGGCFMLCQLEVIAFVSVLLYLGSQFTPTVCCKRGLANLMIA
jgi:hypothetical protein